MAIIVPTTCITNSITLAPGESFVLPPGASIIGSSDTASIASECVDITSLEVAECYIAKVVLFSKNDNIGMWFEDNHQCILGYSLNHINKNLGTCQSPGPLHSGYYYPGPDNIINATNAGFLKALKVDLPSILSYNGLTMMDGSSYNAIYVYQILTFPSIGDNLEIIIETSAEKFVTNAFYRVKFEKRSVATGPLPTSLC